MSLMTFSIAYSLEYKKNKGFFSSLTQGIAALREHGAFGGVGHSIKRFMQPRILREHAWIFAIAGFA